MGSSMDLTAVFVVFVVIGVPIIFGFTLIAHRLKLQQEQFRMLMEERKVLIQNGARDLPPVALPASSWSGRWRSRFHDLHVGVVFTLVAAVTGAYAALHDGKLNVFGADIPNVLILIVGAVGVAHLILYFLREAYNRREAAREQAADPTGCGPQTGPR